MLSRRSTYRAHGAARRARMRAALLALRLKYGEHIIRYAAELAAPSAGGRRAPLSTGSFALDLLTSGLVRGHISEYGGVEGSGTSALAAAALAACQRAGGLAVLLDADATADPDTLEEAGVDLAQLVLVCPTTAIEGWDAALGLVRSGALDLLVVASLSGLVTLPGVGWGARSLSWRLDRLLTAARGRPTALLITNTPLGLHSGSRPGSLPSAADVARSWRTVGGHAVAQAASLRVALQPGGVQRTPYGDVAALRVLAAVVKCRGLAREPVVEVAITPRGPRRAVEVLTLGRLAGCIQEMPQGLLAAGTLLGRSVARAADHLDADPALAAEVEARVRVAWATHGAPAATAS